MKGHGTKRKPIYGFLYVYNRNEVSSSRRFQDICENSILTSKSRAKVKGHDTKQKPYMVYYMYIIEMKSLSLAVLEIFANIAF